MQTGACFWMQKINTYIYEVIYRSLVVYFLNNYLVALTTFLTTFLTTGSGSSSSESSDCFS